MAQKKRAVKPIKITLTEEQISSIIERAARTRRGLKVESLEDRIAPSLIGVPLPGDPISGDTPPLDPNLGDTPPDVPPEGLPSDVTDSGDVTENTPYVPSDPNLETPPEGLPSTDPDVTENTPYVPPSSPPSSPFPPGIDPDTGQPYATDPTSGESFDPNAPPGFVPPNSPVDPDNAPPVAPGPDNANPDPFTFQVAGDAPDGFQGFQNNPADNPLWAERANEMFQEYVNQSIADTGSIPSPEEMEAYRNNILRQLRGDDGSQPPV